MQIEDAVARAVLTPLAPGVLKPRSPAPGAENQVFGPKSQVSDFVTGHVEVIAAINATDATPFPDLLRAWCRSLPSSDP